MRLHREIVRGVRFAARVLIENGPLQRIVAGAVAVAFVAVFRAGAATSYHGPNFGIDGSPFKLPRMEPLPLV